jgi:hypothetical protein
MNFNKNLLKSIDDNMNWEEIKKNIVKSKRRIIMGFLLILTLTTFIFGILWYSFDFDLCGVIATIISIVLLISIVIVPFSRYYSVKRINEFQTRKAVIAQQRNINISELERVNLTNEILDDNAWLSNVQYDRNNIWFNIYYSKEVLNLQPIQ